AGDVGQVSTEERNYRRIQVVVVGQLFIRVRERRPEDDFADVGRQRERIGPREGGLVLRREDQRPPGLDFRRAGLIVRIVGRDRTDLTERRVEVRIVEVEVETVQRCKL